MKILAAAVACLTMVSVFADETLIARNMLGTPQKFGTWINNKKAKFNAKGGPDGKSYVTISAADLKDAFQIAKFMHADVAKMKGRKVVLYGKIKAEDVKKAAKPWLGIKFLIAYQVKDKKGTRFVEGKFPRSGSFDWKEFETSIKLPEDLSMFCINIGLQETSGTIHVSDVELKFDE